MFVFDLLLPSSSSIDSISSSIFTSCPTPRCVSEGREEERHYRRDIGEASNFVHYYLIVDRESKRGSGRGDDHLLMVTQYNQQRVYSGVPKIVVKLHRLEVGTGAMARVEDLGDSILFGGGHAPGHGLSRSQKGLHLLRTHPLSSPPFLPIRKVLFPQGIRRAAEEPAGWYWIQLCPVPPRPISDNLQSSLDYSPTPSPSNSSIYSVCVCA